MIKIRLKRFLLINQRIYKYREKCNNREWLIILLLKIEKVLQLYGFLKCCEVRQFGMYLFCEAPVPVLAPVPVPPPVPAPYCRQRRLRGSGSVKKNPEPPHCSVSQFPQRDRFMNLILQKRKKVCFEAVEAILRPKTKIFGKSMVTP